MTAKAPNPTPSDLDVLSFRFRDTMYPSLRSFFGDDTHFLEFLMQFGGLKFMVPPHSEQDRARMCAEALELLAVLNHASSTGRHVDAAFADDELQVLRKKWEYKGSQWKAFLKRLQESEAEIAEHARACKKALGET